MANEFDVHILSPDGIQRAARLSKAFEALVAELDAVGLVRTTDMNDKPLPPHATIGGRERALVITHLQIASMFAKRAMALNPSNQVDQ